MDCDRSFWLQLFLGNKTQRNIHRLLLAVNRLFGYHRIRTVQPKIMVQNIEEAVQIADVKNVAFLHLPLRLELACGARVYAVGLQLTHMEYIPFDYREVVCDGGGSVIGHLPGRERNHQIPLRAIGPFHRLEIALQLNGIRRLTLRQMNHALQLVSREGGIACPLDSCGSILGSGGDREADVHQSSWTVRDDLCLRLPNLRL